MPEAPNLEAVFFATSSRDESEADKVLASLGIEYSVRIEVIEERKAAGICFQGLLYEVAPDAAAAVRQRFVENGLQRGIVEHGELPH